MKKDLNKNKRYIMWTCLTCESDYDETEFDLDQNLCYSCVDEDEELFAEERRQEEEQAYREHVEFSIEDEYYS